MRLIDLNPMNQNKRFLIVHPDSREEGLRECRNFPVDPTKIIVVEDNEFPKDTGLLTDTLSYGQN